MILTEDECFAALDDNITAVEETRACEEEWTVIVAMCRAIESAVIAKLAQGVSVEPVHHIMSDGVAIGYYSLDQLTTIAAAQGQDLLEIMCARIKAADDAMADGDYMLDSDDCISVIRGTWKPPMLNDKPAAPTPQAAAQPSAPSDTAITYMTGYSDGREWAGATNQAQPSQAVELDYEKKLDIVSNWFSDEGMQSRAMQMLGDIEQAIAAAPQPKETK